MKSPYIAMATACCASLLLITTAQAGSGLLGLDHYVTKDESGIWARKNQMLLFNTLLVGTGAAAVWAGGDTRFGRTMWKSIDAVVVSGAAAQAMKLAFSRSRPNQSPDPELRIVKPPLEIAHFVWGCSKTYA